MYCTYARDVSISGSFCNYIKDFLCLRWVKSSSRFCKKDPISAHVAINSKCLIKYNANKSLDCRTHRLLKWLLGSIPIPMLQRLKRSLAWKVSLLIEYMNFIRCFPTYLRTAFASHRHWEIHQTSYQAHHRQNYLIDPQHFSLQYFSTQENRECCQRVYSVRRHPGQVVEKQPTWQFRGETVEQKKNRAAVIKQRYQTFYKEFSSRT